ncbi:MAG: hypothetical protein ACLRMZ_00885 [Blautia marasmi]
MFGSKVLVCPVLYEGVRERNVYLPEGKWKNINDNRIYDGGAGYTCAAPYDSIPVFVKAGELEDIFKRIRQTGRAGCLPAGERKGKKAGMTYGQWYDIWL